MSMNAMGKHQSGAALFTALIFLIVITMLSLTAMRGSTLALRMASNQELKSIAFQRAQAVVDATVGNSSNLPTVGVEGATNCMTTDPDSGDATICNSTGIDLDDNYLSGTAYAEFFDGDEADGEIYTRATRLAPLQAPAPRSIGTSASLYSVATFQVDGTYDLSAVGQGRAQIREGLMVLISN